MTGTFSKHIPTIETVIGYTFNDKCLLEQAFTRTSFCNEQSAREPVRRQSGEVLEFFGDSILSAAIVSLLIHDHSERYIYGIRTTLDEGDLSNIKSRLSDKRNLSKSMQGLGLQQYLLMGEGDRKLGIENEPSVMEDLFESILGAIYIDSGMHLEPVMQAVRHMLDVSEYLHPQQKILLQSEKNILQEYCADKHRRLPQPVYEDVSTTGPEHERVYTRACRIGDTIMGTGSGKNRKAADTEAARATLHALRQQEAAAHPSPDIRQDSLRLLVEVAARMQLGIPVYVDLGRTDGTDMVFAAECRLSHHCTRGTGRSKREARRMAAACMLLLLKQ